MRGKPRASLDLIRSAYEILETIQPASVRAVCYQLFIRRVIPEHAPCRGAVGLRARARDDPVVVDRR
jgi:hypothetical protein